MSKHETQYWKSLASRDRAADAGSPEFFEVPGAADLTTSRRGFLAAAGFGLAGTALASCSRAPVDQAMPFLAQPEAVVPGRPAYYSSTCGACTAGCGLIVKTRDGRPIKLEGNPDHPVSRGGLCAVGQASILGLYDSQRLDAPMRQGQRASWADVDAAIVSGLAQARDARRPVRLLTPTITSPTLRAAVDGFLATFPDARHVAYDALSVSAVLDAHERTHGARVLPRYRFDRAAVIVSVDADFLGTWISPVEYTSGYRAGRRLGDSSASLSFHAQAESRMSLTGSKADLRLVVAPSGYGPLLAHLGNRVARLAGAPPLVDQAGPSPVDAAVIDDLADRLWHARERSLVVCGSHDATIQALCNAANHLLGAYGSTIDIERPSRQRQGHDRELESLVAELASGSVGVLVVAGVNPVYELPGGAALAGHLKKVPLLVSCATHLDETAMVSGFVCPDRHPLESWADAEAVAGVVSMSQPAVQPLGGTRQLIESIAVWSGAPRPAHDLLRDSWQSLVFPRRTAADATFEAFWDRAVHDGFVEVTTPATPARTYAPSSLTLQAPPPTVDGALALVLYPKVGMLDGRGGLNPWLHELPDPISKATWDNYACLSPSTASGLAVADGDVVRVEAGEAGMLELPVLVQPGQHDGIVAVALGYGRLGSERFANVGPRWFEARPTVGDDGRVGRNAAPLAGAGQRRVALQRRAGPRHADREPPATGPDAVAPRDRRAGAPGAPGGRPPPHRAGDDAAGVREGSVSRVAWARRGGRGPVAARPYLHRPSLAHGDRPDGVHGLLGLCGGVPGGEQRAGGRPRRSAPPPRDALDAHRSLLRRPAGRRRGRHPPADAVPALRERVVRDGVSGAGHRAQRGRAQPAGLQPVRGHALLRQ